MRKISSRKLLVLFLTILFVKAQNNILNQSQLPGRSTNNASQQYEETKINSFEETPKSNDKSMKKCDDNLDSEASCKKKSHTFPQMLFSPREFKLTNNNYMVRQIILDEPKIVFILALNNTLSANYTNNQVYQVVKAEIDCSSFNEITFKITDIFNTRFEVPHKEPFPYTKRHDWHHQSLYTIEHAKIGEQFFFRLRRRSTSEIIFDTSSQPLVFSDKYIEISTNVENEKIYGLGDRRYTSFELGTGQFTFWASDAARIDYGMPNMQIYGHHPMYLRKEYESTLFHVVLLRNTYGMQVQYIKDHVLTYKIIGGNIDFRIFIGDKNPETSISLYHNYVNGYTLHPFWAQGFHQSRWGYNTTERIETVWNNYNKLKIPFDSLWSDIDYMEDYHDFTFNTTRLSLEVFYKMFNLTDPFGVHWSSIIDVGVAEKSEFGYEGVIRDLFIKSSITKKPLIGWVWPGRTYFPDFNHPNATQFWYEGFLKIRTSYGLEQSGIWLDMNEFSNFVNGEIIPAPINSTQFVYPFNPCGPDFPLETNTLSLNATHYNEPDAALLFIPNYTLTQYDMHNINGFGEGYSTYLAAKKLGKKLTFILSRSTLFGGGRFVQHWTGDNFSTWEYLRLSIGLIQNFQMFAIPFVGADICGFGGNTTPELCARWHQAGSLYPFARNHNSINNIDQEPYSFPDYPYVLSSVIKVLKVRYALLKFYYHLFVRGQGIGTVFRPLFFEFPEDEFAYEFEGQFMLGEYLMAAPVLKQGNYMTNSTRHQVYFPQNTIFYDFYNYEPMIPGKRTVEVPFDSFIPLFIRSGKIVHTQFADNAVRSRQLSNSFSLMIALDNSHKAKGQILSINSYNSDENIVDNCQNGSNCLLNIHAILNQISNSKFCLILVINRATKQTIVQQIQIYQISILGINNKGKIQSKIIDLAETIQINGIGEKTIEIFFQIEK